MLVFRNVWDYIDLDARVRKKSILLKVLWQDLICEEANKSPWAVAEVGT